MTKLKLYTEEQVRIAIDKSTKFSRYMFEDEKNEVINSLTPIELPSDEEIEQIAKKRYENNQEIFHAAFLNYLRVGFSEGMQSLRDKILQGGNK